MTINVISTAALGSVNSRLSVMELASQRASVVELTVGALPGVDHALEARDLGLEVIAHHAFPGPQGRIVTPDRDSPEQVLDAVCRSGCSFYSLHPRKFADINQTFDWAEEWTQVADRMGVTLCFETMNPVFSRGALTRDNALDSGSDVLALVNRLTGTRAGILADVAHIAIGLRAGTWDSKQVESLTRSGKILAIHASSPSGLKDSHRAVWKDALSLDLCAAMTGEGTLYVIDEGRGTHRG